MELKIVVDATGAVLGRVASFAAKQSLLGKEVAVVNCSNALVTGNKKMILDEYKEARARGGSSLKGPFFPKSPERIMKRAIRGMLSYKEGRGNAAFKRIRCHNELPQELSSKQAITLHKPLRVKSMTLKQLSEYI